MKPRECSITNEKLALDPVALGSEARVARPALFKIVARLDSADDLDAMKRVIAGVYGERAVRRNNLLNLAGRIYLEVEGYAREIAEARAELIRSNARLGGIAVSIQIKRS